MKDYIVYGSLWLTIEWAANSVNKMIINIDEKVRAYNKPDAIEKVLERIRKWLDLYSYRNITIDSHQLTVLQIH